MPLADQLYAELDDAQREALDEQELVEPTDEEKRNGWTAEALTKYLAERRAGAAVATDPHSLHRRLSRRPREQNHTYSPLRWRA